jgi:peptidoglycan/LPS O-acetylase OafA/YrhL
VVYPAAVSALMGLRQFRWLMRPFEELSRYAFAIFLVHIPFFVGWVTTTYVSDSRVKDDYWQLMNTLFLTGFITSTLFVIVVGWLAPAFAERFMGIERRRAPSTTLESVRRG